MELAVALNRPFAELVELDDVELATLVDVLEERGRNAG